MSPQAELKAEEMLPIVLRQQDRSVRVKTAAELLYETESGRIPKPALVALFVADAPETADKRTRILFEALDDPALAPVWQRVCTASGEARTAMSRFEAPPRETTAKVYRSCGWAQSGLAVPAGELGEQFRMIVLGHLLLPYLEAQGGIADVERQLLRILIRGGRLPEPPFQAAELR